MARTQAGAVKVEQVSSAITGITESVARVKGLVDEVSIASRQQSQGIDQVSQAVAQMEKVTQTTAATAEESAAASEELNAQAEQTMQIAQALRVLVGCAGVAMTRAAAARRMPTPATITRMPMAAKAQAIPLTEEEDRALESTGTFGKF
jgi:methyl-accepting chemotaxis protein